ncbi:glycosyltransferase 87 family protein [Actinacidiphila guanduensis]|uniref:glycosyltransferase 87 family protein n=1 Tax=Actinacidiphila guanduensis TaxID=310781 RepID=UPI000AC2DEF8|nr:glycosyltransferase 87 family protein [Actinacidiphila guanduensis]
MALLTAVLLPYDSFRYWTGCAFDPDRSGSAVNIANQSLRGVVARLQHTPHPTPLWLAAAVAVALCGSPRSTRWPGSPSSPRPPW